MKSNKISAEHSGRRFISPVTGIVMATAVTVTERQPSGFRSSVHGRGTGSGQTAQGQVHILA